ncbi:MAG: hypothetical protein AAF433_01895 [Bacteroidota bacterium]
MAEDKEQLIIEAAKRVFIEKGFSDTLRANPHLPIFMLHELTRSPESFLDQFKASGGQLKP